METKNNKYVYSKVIQQNYGQGWEDVSEYECNSQGAPKEFRGYIEVKPHVVKSRNKQSLLSHDLAEYRLTGYRTRVVFRKTLKAVNLV